MIYPACPKCKSNSNIWTRGVIKGDREKLYCRDCSHFFEGDVKPGAVAVIETKEAQVITEGKVNLIPVYPPCPECGERYALRTQRFLTDIDDETRTYKALIVCMRPTGCSHPAFEGNVKATPKNERQLHLATAARNGIAVGATAEERAANKTKVSKAKVRTVRAELYADSNRLTLTKKKFTFQAGSIRETCFKVIEPKGMSLGDFFKAAAKKKVPRDKAIAALAKIMLTGTIAIAKA